MRHGFDPESAKARARHDADNRARAVVVLAQAEQTPMVKELYSALVRSGALLLDRPFLPVPASFLVAREEAALDRAVA